jgi:DNA-binding CsgD family transcriptional regulator
MHSVSSAQLHENAELIVERFRPSKQPVSRSTPITFLIDYSTGKYLYMSEACLGIVGYTVNHFYETGLEDFLSKWHPADFVTLNDEIFPYSLDFLKPLPPEKYADIIFSYNYRVRNPKGDYVTLLQRHSYIPSNIPGMPIGVIGVAFDITHFKNDQSIVYTIEETIEYNGESMNEILFKKIYPVYEVDDRRCLSQRELEILKAISQGLSSKQIADKLCLSIYTVNNHRKNMLTKIGCKTWSELMNYAVKHGLV